MPEPSSTVRIAAVWSWVLPTLGAVAGFGLGFLVRPAFGWVTAQFDTAPGPLRIAAMLPTGWAVLALAIVGAVGGAWLVAEWRAGSLILMVDETGVRLSQDGRDRFVSAGDLASSLRDGPDLVLLDGNGGELSRNRVDDLSTSKVRRALGTIGCRWIEGNPIDPQFQRWVDGDPALPKALNDLLRSRSGAIADGQCGTVYTVTEQLRSAGIAVRDRGGVQEYRTVSRVDRR
jgi:hypothetical protein